MFIVNKTSNDVIGYTVTDTELTSNPQDITNGYYTTDSPAQSLWRVHIPNDQEIIDVKSHYSVGNDISSTLTPLRFIYSLCYCLVYSYKVT